MTQVLVQETSYTVEVTEANNTLIVNTAPVTVTVTSPGPQGAQGADGASGGGTIGGTITGGTQGSVLFLGPAGVLAQDNTNFYYDDTNNELRIGDASTQNAKLVSRSEAADSYNVYLDCSTAPFSTPGGSFTGLRLNQAVANIGQKYGTIAGIALDADNANVISSASSYDNWDNRCLTATLDVTGAHSASGTLLQENNYLSNMILTRNGTLTAPDIYITNQGMIFQAINGVSYNRVGGTCSNYTAALTATASSSGTEINGTMSNTTVGAYIASAGTTSGTSYGYGIDVQCYNSDTNYGIFLRNISGGSLNWGIYDFAGTAHWFKGNIYLGSSAVVPTARLEIESASTVKIGTVRIIKDDGSEVVYRPSADTDVARGTALSTAVSAMASGDALVFGPGTYQISATLTPPASSRMQGIGNPLIYAPSLAADTPAITLSASNTTLDSFRIQANVTCAGIHTATPATISGIVLSNLYCTVTDTDANAIMFTQNSGGGAAEHNVSFDAYDCVFTGGTVGGFGIQCCLSDGDINLYNCNVYGATDGILNRTHLGTGTGVTNIYGGKYESVLDAITSGGGTGNVINVYGAYAYGVQADLYGDDGAINHYWGHFRPDYAVGNGLQIGTNPVLGHVVPYQNDGGQLGTSSYAWSDLFLASGSVINWNAGDLTLTHAANVLTLAGGDFAVPDEAYGSGWNGSTEVPTKNAVYDRLETMKIESFIIAIGDETTAITTGTAKVTFRMPYAFTLSEVRGSLTTASSSGSVVIDINDSGTTIMTTDKITIEASETTSKDATTQPAITDTSLADNAVITIDIDSAGTGAAGAKVYLIGYKT